ncbi:MAG: hypothetical protein ACI4V1_10265, partial [Eubacteriales bacterium]
ENGKYRTNIVILSKEVQENIYRLSLEYVEPMTELVKKAVEEMYEKPECPKNQCFEDMKPTLAERVMSVQGKPYLTSGNGIWGPKYIRHKDGSEWALAGLEKTEIPLEWLELCGNEEYHQVLMLGNRRELASLDVDRAEIPVFPSDGAAACRLFITSCAEAIDDLYISYLERRNQLLAEDIPSYLHGKAVIFANIDFRKLVIDRLIATGWIRLHDDMNRSAMGIWRYQ